MGIWRVWVIKEGGHRFWVGGWKVGRIGRGELDNRMGGWEKTNHSIVKRD